MPLQFRLLVLTWLLASCSLLTSCRPATPPDLVVYCAHDAVFAEQIIRDFESRTGLRVDVRFDTEATKSLGLTELILREAKQPRADVFWNNQLLGTLDLLDADVLEPYQGEGYQRIPPQFKHPEGYWVGFAARFRVYIANTDSLPEITDESAREFERDAPERVTIAQPLFGTTRSHYTVLWSRWGGDRVRQWHANSLQAGVIRARGNAMVKDLVANRQCDLGWTDTDDYFVAKDEGRPVTLLPWRLEDGSTICIPNTVSIMRGARHRAAAERFVDFILSADTETALAASKARQVPLGPVDESQLADEVQALRPWVADAVDLNHLGNARRECLDWLREEYSP